MGRNGIGFTMSYQMVMICPDMAVISLLRFRVFREGSSSSIHRVGDRVRNQNDGLRSGQGKEEGYVVSFIMDSMILFLIGSKFFSRLLRGTFCCAVLCHAMMF